MPDKHGPQRTVLGQFVASVNPGGVGGGAVAVAGWKTMPGGEAALGVLEGEPTLPANFVGLFVPAGARTKQGTEAHVWHGDTLVTIPGISIERDSYRAENPAFVVDAGSMFPTHMGFDVPDDDGAGSATFIEEYVPGVDSGSASDLRVLVPNGREFVDRHGPIKVPDDARTVEPGETVDLANTILAGPTDQLLPGIEAEADPTVLDGGRPVAMAGATMGLGALATPSAEVGGEQANPAVDESTTELLQRDAARRMLRRAGVTDADEVEWLAGPEPTEFPESGDYTPSLLGESTDLELHHGVVSGEDGPWAVALFVARATPDDHVIAAGTIRRPVSAPGAGVNAWPKEYLRNAAEFAGAAIEQLERVEG